jgi:hypothetical protein
MCQSLSKWGGRRLRFFQKILKKTAKQQTMFIFAERRLRLLCVTIRHRQLFIMISSVDCVSRRRVDRKTRSGCVERSISSKQTNRFSTKRRLSRNRRTFKVVTVNTDRFEKGRRRRKNRRIREIDRRATEGPSWGTSMVGTEQMFGSFIGHNSGLSGCFSSA